MPAQNCTRPTLNFLALFLKYFRGSERTKINHTRSNYRHKIRFQGIVYLKLNKRRVKILKNINKTNSTWCVKLIRKQKIIFFFAAWQNAQWKPRKLNMQKWVSYWLQRTKRNRIQHNFHSYTITDKTEKISENKSERHMSIPIWKQEIK